MAGDQTENVQSQSGTGQCNLCVSYFESYEVCFPANQKDCLFA